MQEDVKEAQDFPSPTAIKFSHEGKFKSFDVVRTSATCGPKELHDAHFGTDTYEWEFAGVRIATNGSFFQGELGMISVITECFGQQELNTLSPSQAFDNLAKYLGQFLDTNLLT